MYKKIIAILIVAILLVGTGTAYAYWENSNSITTETINVGYGLTLKMEALAKVPEGKILVPEGEAIRDNDIEEVILTYRVNITEEISKNLDLLVGVNNILIGGDSTYSDLVNIDIQQSSDTVNNNAVLITITVTIIEPSSYEIYSKIVNQNISFTISFDASNGVD
ncbi:MAG: hypothetical protein JEZ05_08145 [Tenericutes bacterium]|nr:hypothetical protein [Mycoplasmatota bacterium]